MVTSLGPVEETLGGSDWSDDDGVRPRAASMAGEEGVAANSPLTGLVDVGVHPDRLSCGEMVLAAARILASRKIKALAAEMGTIAAQLGWV